MSCDIHFASGGVVPQSLRPTLVGEHCCCSFHHALPLLPAEPQFVPNTKVGVNCFVNGAYIPDSVIVKAVRAALERQRKCSR